MYRNIQMHMAEHVQRKEGVLRANVSQVSSVHNTEIRKRHLVVPDKQCKHYFNKALISWFLFLRVTQISIFIVIHREESIGIKRSARDEV